MCLHNLIGKTHCKTIIFFFLLALSLLLFKIVNTYIDDTEGYELLQ